MYYTTDGIRILTPENGQVRLLDTGRCESFAPAFSPDGKWIAFTCEVSGTYYLDLLSTKGGPSKHLSQEVGRRLPGRTTASELLLMGYGNSTYTVASRVD